MKLHPQVTKPLVELVKRFEGFRREAARLPDGGWTVGYGHTLTAREGVWVTPEDAELLLYYDLSDVATKVDAWTFTPLNQNQFEALISFAYNIGLDNFRHSTVLKRINEGHHLQAAAAMELWRKTEVGGEGLVADALVRRRAAEKALYLTPPEGFSPSPSQVLKPMYDLSVIEAAAQSVAARRAVGVETLLEAASVEPVVERPVEPAPLAAIAEEAVHAEMATTNDPAVALIAEAAAAETAPPAPDAPAPPPPSPNPSSSPAPERPTSPLFASGLIAERGPVLALASGLMATRSPQHTPAPEPAKPARLPTAVNDAEPQQPALFPGGAIPNPPPLRVFEPAPRHNRADAAPTSVAATDNSDESEAGEVHPGDFNLFDRPLAPPEPRPSLPSVARDASTPRDDHTFTAPRRRRGGWSVLTDRTVVFAVIGLLGVALFTLAIFTMLVGRATPWHLVVGTLGVALMTSAGIHHLMQRTGARSPAPSELDAQA
jgi:lysozyme